MTSLPFQAACLLCAAALLAMVPAHAIKVMELVPSQLAAHVTVYDHGTLQLRVLPDDGSSFYQVEDVIVAVSHDDSGVSAECKTASACVVTVSDVPYRDVSLELIATAESLTFVHRRGTRELARGIVPLTKDKPDATIHFPSAKKLYGIPEHAVDLALKQDVNYRLYNLDVFHYKMDDPGGIYGTIPFLMAHGPHSTSGLLFLNGADSHVHVQPGEDTAVKYSAEVGLVNIAFFAGPTPAAVQEQHSRLTGPGFLPPLFSLGYNQCRWNYRSSEDCLDVDAGFDAHNIPYDVLWLDIEHTDGKKYFTWDLHNFPKPVELIDAIASKGRKMVTITDPHIKREDGYHVHDQATAKGYYVKGSDGTSDFQGHCWPGTSSWVDFYNKKARDWYATLFSFNSYKDSTPDLYTWIDMNEPSVFNAHEVTMDRDAVHHRADGMAVKHRYLHNMYGFYHTMAAFEGHLLRSREATPARIHRPFILTRSFFAGSQRYCAMWTGDNMAKWDHLQKSIPMLLTLSISNFPFVGADVGGFFFNPEAELMVRWMQAGAFYPFYRGHAHLETKRREPWLFGEDATRRIRDAIALRYTLLPYMYTNFWLSHTVGLPPIRPLFFSFPHDETLYEEQNAFMVGDGLLARPVVEEGATTVSVRLPEASTWFDFFTGEAVQGGIIDRTVTLDTIPLYLRGGSVVAAKHRLRRSSAAMAHDPFTLHVALDKEAASTGRVFIDDHATFDYQSGRFADLTITLAGGKLTCRQAPRNASAADADRRGFAATNLVERIVLYGLSKPPTQVTARYDGPLRTGLVASPAGVPAAGEAALVFAQLPSGAVSINKVGLLLDADWSIVLA